MQRKTALRIAGQLRLDALGPRLWRRSLCVLMYHYFEGAKSDPLVVGGADFKSQMLYLKQHFHVVRLPEALERIARGEALPERSVAITVDDVSEDFGKVAWPILEDLELPVTLAVCPGFAGGAGFWAMFGILHAHLRASPAHAAQLARALGVAELPYERAFDVLAPLAEADLRRCLKELSIPWPYQGPVPGGMRLPVVRLEAMRRWAASGLLDVGCHTMTHVSLPRVSGAWLRFELEESRRQLEAEVGECRLLFYPGGAAPRCEGWEKVVDEAGYRFAFVAAPDVVARGRNRLALGRVAILGGEDAPLFRMRASGWPALRPALGI